MLSIVTEVSPLFHTTFMVIEEMWYNKIKDTRVNMNNATFRRGTAKCSVGRIHFARSEGVKLILRRVNVCTDWF